MVMMLLSGSDDAMTYWLPTAAKMAPTPSPVRDCRSVGDMKKLMKAIRAERNTAMNSFMKYPTPARTTRTGSRDRPT